MNPFPARNEGPRVPVDVIAAIAAHGGRYLARGGATEVLEGLPGEAR